jgi:hypothetical protein
MTVDEVKKRVQLQASLDLELTNGHRITLKQALVLPQQIKVIERSVRNGKFKEQRIDVWLIGQEDSSDGHKIIMRDDGLQFGLASKGFPSVPFLTLTAWYGNLISTFLAM